MCAHLHAKCNSVYEGKKVRQTLVLTIMGHFTPHVENYGIFHSPCFPTNRVRWREIFTGSRDPIASKGTPPHLFSLGAKCQIILLWRLVKPLIVHSYWSTEKPCQFH